MEPQGNDILDPKTDFVAGDYLSPSQVEIVKGLPEDTLEDQKKRIRLIDSFVESNRKTTSQYQEIRELLMRSMGMLETASSYPLRVQESLPVLFGFAYFDLLYLVGIVTEEDLEKAKQGLMGPLGMVKTPPVPKA